MGGQGRLAACLRNPIRAQRGRRGVTWSTGSASARGYQALPIIPQHDMRLANRTVALIGDGYAPFATRRGVLLKPLPLDAVSP